MKDQKTIDEILETMEYEDDLRKYRELNDKMVREDDYDDHDDDYYR